MYLKIRVAIFKGRDRDRPAFGMDGTIWMGGGIGVDWAKG